MKQTTFIFSSKTLFLNNMTVVRNVLVALGARVPFFFDVIKNAFDYSVLKNEISN